MFMTGMSEQPQRERERERERERDVRITLRGKSISSTDLSLLKVEKGSKDKKRQLLPLKIYPITLIMTRLCSDSEDPQTDLRLLC